MRGYTSIPFAKQAAELISYPDSFVPDYTNTDPLFWARVLHFETRYLGINQLLSDIDIRNYLEISSGFSFRCIEKVKEKGNFYIDTDLPELIAKKKEMLKILTDEEYLTNLKLLPLNALDENQFQQTVNILPPGKVALINEGLLVYLSTSEKEKLCKNIRAILKERGGFWITSDIYIRTTIPTNGPTQDKELKEFSEKHNIEKNKFTSFDEAEAFFRDNGFIIDKEESIDISKLSSYSYFAKYMKINFATSQNRANKLQTTWRLKTVE